jgi:flagellar biogenesis protein FliO
MNIGFTVLGMLCALAVYGIVLWVLWKFYQAIARIGEELGEIKTILQQRVPPTEKPSGL